MNKLWAFLLSSIQVMSAKFYQFFYHAQGWYLFNARWKDSSNVKEFTRSPMTKSRREKKKHLSNHPRGG